MRHITIRQLHEKTGRIVDEAATGEVIVIQRRGVSVAELRSASKTPRRVKVPAFARRYARFPRVQTDSGRFLEEDRR